MPKGFFWRHRVIEGSLNVMVDVCYSAVSVGMIFLINIILAACHIFGALLN